MIGTLSGGSVAVIVLVLAILLIWGFVFAAIMRDRAPETPIPANLKPYHDDNVLETTRLEKLLQTAVIALLFLALAAGAYFVWEPSRQKSEYLALSEKAVKRGEIIFGPTIGKDGHPILGAADCQRCHGPDAKGGSNQFTVTKADGKQEKVTWAVPALNDVFLRYTPDEVRTIITYGRKGTPMPGWGKLGGGAMSEQQIEDAMAWLESIQEKPAQAQAQNADVGKTPTGYDGKTLFNQFCARCHTIGSSYGEPQAPGSGGFGPPLAGGSLAAQFPDPAAQVKFVTEGSEWQKEYGARGLGQGRMPAFGEILLPEQIQAIVNYERSLIPEAPAK